MEEVSSMFRSSMAYAFIHKVFRIDGVTLKQYDYPTDPNEPTKHTPVMESRPHHPRPRPRPHHPRPRPDYSKPRPPLPRPRDRDRDPILFLSNIFLHKKTSFFSLGILESTTDRVLFLCLYVFSFPPLQVLWSCRTRNVCLH